VRGDIGAFSWQTVGEGIAKSVRSQEQESGQEIRLCHFCCSS